MDLDAENENAVQGEGEIVQEKPVIVKDNVSKIDVEKLENKIEGCARVFFPVAYGSFLMLYFIFYLNRNDNLQAK